MGTKKKQYALALDDRRNHRAIEACTLGVPYVVWVVPVTEPNAEPITAIGTRNIEPGGRETFTVEVSRGTEPRTHTWAWDALLDATLHRRMPP